MVCEDQYTEVVANRLIGVTPAGTTYVLGALRVRTEVAGICFTPDGGTLHVVDPDDVQVWALQGAALFRQRFSFPTRVQAQLSELTMF